MTRKKGGALSAKPRLTNARYKQIVRELEYLSRKYEGDLERVIPSFREEIKQAKERIERHSIERHSEDRGAGHRGAGAPTLWRAGQLARLWRIVRALQIANPKLDDREACQLLAWEGFWVWDHDPRSTIMVEDVYRFIDNPETLRKRFGEAKRTLLSEDIRELEEEAHELAKHSRIVSLLRREKIPHVRGI
jgi:hypothetical protein